MTDDALYLRHILDATKLIGRYVAVGRDEFFTQTHWQDAVVRQLEIIGEATKRLSETVTSQHSDIPWRRIAGMRDVLIHNYMGVDLETVWEVTQRDVSRLGGRVEQILQDSEPPREAHEDDE